MPAASAAAPPVGPAGAAAACWAGRALTARAPWPAAPPRCRCGSPPPAAGCGCGGGAAPSQLRWPAAARPAATPLPAGVAALQTGCPRQRPFRCADPGRLARRAAGRPASPAGLRACRLGCVWVMAGSPRRCRRSTQQAPLPPPPPPPAGGVLRRRSAHRPEWTPRILFRLPWRPAAAERQRAKRAVTPSRRRAGRRWARDRWRAGSRNGMRNRRPRPRQPVVSAAGTLRRRRRSGASLASA